MAHVLITGASTGLGRALAVEFGRRGHSLGLVARRGDLLEAVASEVRAAGGRAASATADVTDRRALQAAVASLVEALGPVDILIANAGAGGPTPATKIDAERICAMMRLNYDGVVYAVEAALPDMLRRGAGQIVAVSSVAGWRGLPASGAYSASKAAVSTLMESFGIELRSRGIAVTTVHPGFVKTPLTAKNRFPMPFLLEADRAARIMVDGILARRRTVDFPFRMVLLMGFVRRLPAAVYELGALRMTPGASDQVPKNEAKQ
jgi:short-subunit dehydrogenase